MRADDMRGSRQPASTEPPTRMTDAAQDATTAEAFVPLRWERFGPERQVLVTFVLPGAIPDPVWDAMVEDELKSPDLRFVLTVTVGRAVVNSLQRKKAAEVLVKNNVQTIVVTDDSLTRGIATAVSWLGVRLKAYRWTDLDRAVMMLQMPESDGKSITEAAQSFLLQSQNAAKAKA